MLSLRPHSTQLFTLFCDFPNEGFYSIKQINIEFGMIQIVDSLHKVILKELGLLAFKVV